ncbi:MAG: hypothetical protein ACSHWZ_17210 [Sulfitobacter sp.]
MSGRLETDGFQTYPFDPATAAWAAAAKARMQKITEDPGIMAQNLRHGDTWFVGVDVLPNGPDGAVDGVPLAGTWQEDVPDLPQHRAQVSIIYPGYPQQDAEQSDANHRYRVRRLAAHVDGLLPEGPSRRRFAREYHAYILALPLNHCAASPTVVWRGSYKIMQAAIVSAIGDSPVGQVDVTDAYHAARRDVFDRCTPVPLHLGPGEAGLIHRFALHGTEIWGKSSGTGDSEGRMIAFFRPEFPDPQTWLRG